MEMEKADAFVLVIAKPGREKEVLEALKKTDGTKEIYPVYHVYDFIIRLKAEDGDRHRLEEIIRWQIRRTPYVLSTYTLWVVDL